MTQMTSNESADRRLRILRFGLIAVTAVAFSLAAAIGFFAAGGALGGALLQGALWGAGAAVVSVIVYMVYKNVVVKA